MEKRGTQLPLFEQQPVLCGEERNIHDVLLKKVHRPRSLVWSQHCTTFPCLTPITAHTRSGGKETVLLSWIALYSHIILGERYQVGWNLISSPLITYRCFHEFKIVKNLHHMTNCAFYSCCTSRMEYLLHFIIVLIHPSIHSAHIRLSYM
jgi:hypothetical protein